MPQIRGDFTRERGIPYLFSKHQEPPVYGRVIGGAFIYKLRIRFAVLKKFLLLLAVVQGREKRRTKRELISYTREVFCENVQFGFRFWIKHEFSPNNQITN